jgi:hypothetical protein
MGEKGNACRILVGTRELKRPLGGPRRRWVDDIKMDLGYDGMWIGLVWLRIGTVEGSCQHRNEPSGSIKCWEFLEQLHIWRLLKKNSVPA